MTIFSKFAKSQEIPYGTTVMLKSNDAVATEIKKRSVKHEKKMRELAVQGGDDIEPATVIREMKTDTLEGINHETLMAGAELRSLFSQIPTIEEIDPELRLADVNTTILTETRPRQDDAVAAATASIGHRLHHNAFRGNLNINREADMPNGLLTMLNVILCLACELVIGYFLYRDVEADALSAFSMAIMFSGGIAVLGLGTGWFGVRFAFYGHGLSERTFGICTLLVGLFLSLYLALLISHDRDHLATFNPDADFIRRFDWSVVFHPTDWFNFETIQGPTFLIVLAVLAAFSVWKGAIGFKDIIPGYTEHFAKWRDASNKADDQVRQLRQAAKAPIERETALVDQKLRDDQTRIQQGRKLVEMAGNREHRHRDTVMLTISIANGAISRAQEAYLSVRPQKPAYFDQFLTVADIPELPVTTAMVADRMGEIETIAAENRQHATRLKLGLHDLYQTWDERLQSELAGLEELGTRKFRQERSTFEQMGM